MARTRGRRNPFEGFVIGVVVFIVPFAAAFVAAIAVYHAGLTSPGAQVGTVWLGTLIVVVTFCATGIAGMVWAWRSGKRSDRRRLAQRAAAHAAALEAHRATLAEEAAARAARATRPAPRRRSTRLTPAG